MKESILIVDDSEMNRDMLAEILGDEYDTTELANGSEAIDFLKTGAGTTSAILLDLRMPKVDGFGVLNFMKEENLINKIPVLVISADDTSASETECLKLGVSDFIHKPFDSEIVKQRIRNVTELFSYKNELEKKVAKQTERLMQQNDTLINVLGNVVEYRNLESGEHIKRVKGFTRILAKKYAQMYPEAGLTGERIEVIAAASALHDLGKIAISDAVLLKPGKLTPEEFEQMKTHTTKGCELIEQIDGVWDEDYKDTSYEICRYHHERYDGKGYPDGLKGDEIPLSAQLVSVADVYDALVSKRVYKEAYGKEEAYDMIISGKCGCFSPKLLECFKASKEAFEKSAHL